MNTAAIIYGVLAAYCLICVIRNAVVLKHYLHANQLVSDRCNLGILCIKCNQAKSGSKNVDYRSDSHLLLLGRYLIKNGLWTPKKDNVI